MGYSSYPLARGRAFVNHFFISLQKIHKGVIEFYVFTSAAFVYCL